LVPLTGGKIPAQCNIDFISVFVKKTKVQWILKMKKTGILCILCMLLVVSCSIMKPMRLTLSINGRPLTVEVARTKAQRKKGLMYRDELGRHEGMLFVFREDQYLSFWMKNTKIPLSIAFLDKNGKVTDIYDMEPYSLYTVRSTKKCRYAIEVNRGFFNECTLLVGDTIDLSLLR